MRDMFEQQMTASGANIRFKDIKPFMSAASWSSP